MTEAAQPSSRLGRLWDSDLVWDFRHDPVAIGAALGLLFILAAAALAPVIAPSDPFDLGSVELADSLLPPGWNAGGVAAHPLGTDDQGRDLLAAILYGTRISLLVGVLSVLAAVAIGTVLGLAAGLAGGMTDALIMRVADVQLSFPAILIALLVDGVARALLPGNRHDAVAVPIIVAAIALSGWVQYARTVRGSTVVQRGRDYVHAARLYGVPRWRLAFRHILPNVGGPVVVLATVHLATAIVTEATLSFLGVGIPPTTPSLGTLVRNGNDYLLSGEWWLAIFPGCALVLLVLATNLFGDWLRDEIDPRLR
jgi:peptide/nickel transport system permease protein